MKKLFVTLSFVALLLSMTSCGLSGRSNDKPVRDNASEEQPQEQVATPEPAPKPNENHIYANAFDGFVNVCAQPSAKSAKLGKLNNGTDYLVKLGVQGKWIKVKWQNTVGYVDSSLVGHTPWKPVTLSVDANQIEGHYSFNHSDLFVFSNGRFIFFYNRGPMEYGVWRFEGNQIVLTTQYITDYGQSLIKDCLSDSFLGKELRMVVDEQNNQIGCMFRCRLTPKQACDDEVCPDTWPYGYIFLGDGETISISKEGFMMYKQKATKLVSPK